MMGKCRGLYLLPFLAYVALGCDNTDCVTIENPTTNLLEYNDTVDISCGIKDTSGSNSQPLMVFDNTMELTTNETSMLEDRGIINASCNQDTKLCTATVFGNEANNGLEIHCSVGGCCTESAFIYVVNGIPDPFNPPVVTFINTMLLNISWNPPWNSSVIPVNNYSLFITDNNTGVQLDTIITTDRYFIFEKQDNVSCEDVYLFSVLADTDFGETDVSDTSSATVFLIVDDIGLLLDTDLIELTKYNTYNENTEQMLRPSLYISFEPPMVCDHIMLTYQFKLKDLLPPYNEVAHNSGGNSSAVLELSNYLFHDDVLMVSVEVNVSDGYSNINILLYENITYTLFNELSTTSTTQLLSFTVLVIIVAASAVLAASIACLGIVCIFCCCYCRKSKRAVLDDANRNITFLSIIQKPLEEEVRDEQEMKAKQIAKEINMKCGRNVYFQ